MADRKFATPIDLTGLALNNAVLQPLGSAPSSPAVGRMYFDTVALAPRFWDGTTWTNVASNSALLNNQNAAYYLNRTNHTGTQTASTISDFASAAALLRLDQFAAPTAPVSFNSQRITNVGTPTSGTDATNKTYVDNLVAAISWKDEVATVATTNITLASGAANGSSVGGYTLATGDRFALIGQTAPAENGIYTANATGAPTRATDADTAAEIQGAAFYVANGTSAGSRYVNNNTGAITIGTTGLTFASFGGGATYSAGNGMSLTGSVFAVLPDPVSGGGILVSSSGVKVDPAVVVRKYSVDIGDGTSTSITVTHNLGTKDVTAQIYDNTAPFSQLEADVQHSTTNTLTVVFAVAPTTAKYRIVVHG